jgi:hypothetical protein
MSFVFNEISKYLWLLVSVLSHSEEILFLNLGLEGDSMGFKGLIRDIIMFYLGVQLIFFNFDRVTAGIILIVSAIIFTILGFIIAFGSG